jgi:protein-serine/threonine kinase
MAPEVIREGSVYDFKADIWSLGITVYEIATGNPPYAEQDPRSALMMLSQNKPPKLVGPFSPLIKEFVALCLTSNPEERPTADELLKHRFIKAYSKIPASVLKELIIRHERYKSVRNSRTSMMLVPDPDASTGSSDEDDENSANISCWNFDTVKSQLQNEVHLTEPAIKYKNLAVKAIEAINQTDPFDITSPTLPDLPDKPSTITQTAESDTIKLKTIIPPHNRQDNPLSKMFFDQEKDDIPLGEMPKSSYNFETAKKPTIINIPTDDQIPVSTTQKSTSSVSRTAKHPANSIPFNQDRSVEPLFPPPKSALRSTAARQKAIARAEDQTATLPPQLPRATSEQPQIPPPPSDQRVQQLKQSKITTKRRSKSLSQLAKDELQSLIDSPPLIPKNFYAQRKPSTMSLANSTSSPLKFSNTSSPISKHAQTPPSSKLIPVAAITIPSKTHMKVICILIYYMPLLTL